MSTLLDDLHQMWRSRLLEEKIRDLRLAGEIQGSVHLSIGQEAGPVGACSVLGPDDALFATYRGHNWAVARGVPVEGILAELLGRETGVNGGRGGSAYFSDVAHGFHGENSIVGAGAPLAVGAALAGKYDGSNRVALTVFGDGAMNQGAVHESMNFAAALDLPVIFVCENNGWSELTPIDDMVRNPILAERARAYGMLGERIDGNDPAVVRDRVGDAIEAAREGGGPALLELMTQRLVGHYIGDAEQYRRPGELEAAKEKEPIAVAKRKLAAAGVPQNQIDDAEARAREEIDAAAATAQAAPLADPSTVKEHLYA
ncbi:thiamine pyrophosphate-dependent dehydrogenase E1 component subunit alpha [Cryptosporangium phraense]|uniref:Thiamine pyrophosphate-dependent dehydrogenase E1 component subunit alpha n=1 Tax=Cryptosporangium phraense TaxID=2593070 RepID=A0A545AHL6_9ACTN|nr:thiamine pyrophosphate-dependent dehydrogenase E1 component subunit alpha [Cryptosporangium phraense]TQS40806.1 thiamine pyrophosphate-dependent dehydrogenase E1 component subunit alpha [Cryptosporangium phraense]